MPTYDYKCDSCGHEFELFQQMSAPVKKKCPECLKLTLKRLIGTGAAVVFKGSGFYETDYRSDSYKKAAKADSETSKPKEKKKSEEKNSGSVEKKKKK
ncbi:MAG: zinc ribbon domain-containing protein [Phycisphaerales bacterium]|jgi:putative FmdB family regulatory protein|nr:zinc ribbon domain-containing protein [Phycisphaerales bacterium]